MPFKEHSVRKPKQNPLVFSMDNALSAFHAFIRVIPFPRTFLIYLFILSNFSINITSARCFIWILTLYWVSLFYFPLALCSSHIIRCYITHYFFPRIMLILVFAVFQVLFTVTGTELYSINVCFTNERNA